MDDIPTVIGQFKDGSLVARGVTTDILPTGGNYAITVTVPDLREVEFVVGILFVTDPITSPGIATNRKITGNVVGFTLLNVGTGTTLISIVIAKGQ